MLARCWQYSSSHNSYRRVFFPEGQRCSTSFILVDFPFLLSVYGTCMESYIAHAAQDLFQGPYPSRAALKVCEIDHTPTKIRRKSPAFAAVLQTGQRRSTFNALVTHLVIDILAIMHEGHQKRRRPTVCRINDRTSNSSLRSTPQNTPYR